MKKIDIKKLAIIGMLTALEIVLSRFLSINAWNIKIGFSFVPIVIAAILYGWIPAAIIASLGDFLGAILFPIGAYFPGFTLTALITGITFGLFLRDNQNISRIISSVAIVQIVLGLFINTLWISILYGADYWPLFVTRLLQVGILLVIQILVIKIISISIHKVKNELK